MDDSFTLGLVNYGIKDVSTFLAAMDGGAGAGMADEFPEFLTGTLRNVLDVWVCHRKAIQEVLTTHNPSRSHSINPQVLQKMAVVMGDLGNIVERISPPVVSKPQPTLSPVTAAQGNGEDVDPSVQPQYMDQARSLIFEGRRLGPMSVKGEGHGHC